MVIGKDEGETESRDACSCCASIDMSPHNAALSQEEGRKGGEDKRKGLSRD